MECDVPKRTQDHPTITSNLLEVSVLQKKIPAAACPTRSWHMSRHTLERASIQPSIEPSRHIPRTDIQMEDNTYVYLRPILG